MSVRELLQREVWSKRTSRKILIGFAILFAGFVIWSTAYVIDNAWITPSERKTANAALKQIDVLQNFDGMSDTEFDLGVLHAKGKVGDAEHAARTSRDKRIAMAVSFYLTETKDLRNQSKWIQRSSLTPDKKKSEIEFSRNLQKVFGDALHKLLE